ncbi:hypothetical protein PTSG_04136 [Salpingoeca rosetta]|uniref:SMP-30/Gluconolactonase/LRE-like region domain-containing protein n=1 Tax=Salpingoeca rosetta (strain ATCC 50818 / BSB-021) TaxID=946362 RepID=F2U6P5_SALR5|nr:uncharacterized protein PTSG_04136 [Salpingoeca rosetta]EGD83527.1 hypothetical protein PTSG_04136 [Salpingoeca rosetta]|eukprot:XP_004995031.1 hypothetical protein PTSG_04136 [Salpingoeca rosetta]
MPAAIVLPVTVAAVTALLSFILPRTHLGTVISLEPGFDAMFVNSHYGMEVLAEGFDWAEGPAWLPHNNALNLEPGVVFSAVRENAIYIYTEHGGRDRDAGVFHVDTHAGCDGDDCKQMVEPGTNGLVYHEKLEGLIRCEHGRRVLGITLADDKHVVLASSFEGHRFNSPNDVTIMPNGDVIFTDPPYGLNFKNETDNFEASAHRDLNYNGVFLLTLKQMQAAIASGSPQEPKRLRMLSKMARPNGIAANGTNAFVISNCEASPRGFWARCKLDTSGHTKCKTFAEVKDAYAKYFGKPDGLKIDSEGRLWATGPGGVRVYDQQGNLQGLLLTGRKTGNLVFSPEPDNALYITADNMLLRMRLKHSIAA